jgi:uncharacterized damage-inducible protein DinB
MVSIPQRIVLHPGLPSQLQSPEISSKIKLTTMDFSDHLQMLARYNRIANERILERCSLLNGDEYQAHRQGSFGSISGILNHLLLGDRIWMARFSGGGKDTPPLNTILFSNISELKTARIDQDICIEEFFQHLPADFLSRSFRYKNSQGRAITETAPVAVIHFFNHQTHHRGQVHVMLSQTSIPPPSLDLHRIINP